MTNLANLTLKGSDFTPAIWSYKKISSNFFKMHKKVYYI